MSEIKFLIIIKMMRNTKRKGKFIIFVYPETSKHFIGVNLTFDLVVEGDNPGEALERIRKASLDYIETVCKEKLNDELLNRRAPQKYWNRLRKHLNRVLKESGKRGPVKWEDYFQEVPYPDKICV